LEDDCDFEVLFWHLKRGEQSENMIFLKMPINEAEMLRFPGMCDEGEDEYVYEDDAISRRHRVHKKFWQLNWTRVHFTGLPTWLQDNEFLHFGHRPQLGNFGSCFKSIFSLHTETGNIWTHMYGQFSPI
jgi:adiponectin receptor